MNHLNFLSRAFVAIVAMLSIGLSAFAYSFEAGGIYYNITNSTNKTVEVTSGTEVYSGSVSIPSSVTYNGTYYSVSEIGRNAFRGCSELTEVTIPNSVTEIGEDAFYRCSGLTSITIPNSVTEIGYYAFEYCYGLTEVNITDLSAWCKIDFGNYSANPLCYAQHLFLNGEEIKNLVIPNDITQIKKYAFYGCTGLTSVTIPNSVIYIGDYAFDECYGLTEVNITDLSAWCKIDFGDYYANPLYYAKKLKLNGTVITNLVIPNDITQIKKYAFYGCTGLTSVTIPNSVTSIGDGAFSECSGLTSVTIGNSVTKIGNYAFNGCTGLKELIIEDGTETLSLGYNGYYYTGEGLFYDCPIEKLYLGRNLSYNTGYEYGYSPFYNCDELTSVTIGNSVTKIGHRAFKGCSRLTSITIPNSVTEIGDDAFYDCYLKSVTSYCMTPPRCYHDAFGGSYSAILKVPEGTKDAYANANEWYRFNNIQEIAGVEDVLIDNVVVKIAVENGNISINGIENPHIEIYNINGKCIYSGNDTTIPVSDTGVYILRINGKSYKIVNK